jgi:mannose-6-phosphate isomerase-like protein (cupin superfamily)
MERTAVSDSGVPEHHFRPEWALEQLPGRDDADWRVLFEHGSFELEIYAPRGRDPQEPHDRDEIYVVISGTGTFINGLRRHDFGPGDLLFVPAGTVHRFEEFSDDFATWVIFYGPAGGG